MAHTLVRCLRQRHSGVVIDMLAPMATAPVAQRMAEIDTTHVVDFQHGELGLNKRRQVGKQMRMLNYDAAFVLPNSWKSALVPWFAGIELRIGWSGEARLGLLNDRRKLVKARYPLMIERFMALADPAGELPEQPYPFPQLQPDRSRALALADKFNLPTENVVILCPGAEFGPAKKWPVEHFAELASQLLELGQQVWLMGSPKDAQDTAKIKGLAPACFDLAGKTSLTDAIDLMSFAGQAVCNDSGLMHVACALGVPTVGVFGSTSPGFTPPLGERAVVVEQSLACRPCFQRECPLGHLDCLRTLTPKLVLEQMSFV